MQMRFDCVATAAAYSSRVSGPLRRAAYNLRLLPADAAARLVLSYFLADRFRRICILSALRASWIPLARIEFN